MAEIKKILMIFIIGLVLLLPVYPVMASLSPPTSETTVKLEFTSPEREKIEAIVTDGNTERDPLTLTKQSIELEAKDISEFDEVKLPSDAKNFTVYQLSNSVGQCVRSSGDIYFPEVTHYPILLIAYTVNDDSHYYNLGSFISIGGKYTRIRLKGLYTNCEIYDNKPVTDFIYASIRHAQSAGDIDYALDPKDIEANCNALNDRWEAVKANMRALLFPVEGRPNPEYWDTSSDLDPDINRENIKFGTIAGSFAVGLATGGIGALTKLYTSDAYDVEVIMRYELTKSGLSYFDSIGENINRLRSSIVMLKGKGDNIKTVCPGIPDLTKFKWDKEIESESYTSFSNFLEELDDVYNKFLELFEIASRSLDTGDDPKNDCDNIKGDFITQAVNGAFCAIIIFIKTGVDSIYDTALNLMNSSIGVDITQEELPDEPSTIDNSDTNSLPPSS